MTSPPLQGPNSRDHASWMRRNSDGYTTKRRKGSISAIYGLVQADRKYVDSPEELITVRHGLQRPNQESVGRRVPDLADCLRRVNVQYGEGPIARTRLHARPLAIGLGESRAKRPLLRLRHRTVASKRVPQRPAEREESANRKAQESRSRRLRYSSSVARDQAAEVPVPTIG